MSSRTGSPLALLAALVMLVSAAPPVGAAEPEAQAWWYQARSSELPIETPVPPTVDEDGLYVAAGPTGAIAIAALRAPVGDAAQVVIALELTDSTGTVIFGACRTEPWQPVQAGNWDDRPEADCEAGAVGAVIAEDGSAATIDATSLVDQGVLDVVLIPGVAEDGTPANFSASIAPPGSDSIAATSAPETSTPPDAPPTSPTADPVSPFAPGPAQPLPSSTAPAADFRPASGIAIPPEPETALEIPPVAEELAAPVASRPLASTPGGPAGDIGRLLGLGLVAALGASYVVLRGRQGPVPAPLLAFAGRTTPVVATSAVRTTTSGVGRFARERTGRAPPLS